LQNNHLYQPNFQRCNSEALNLIQNLVVAPNSQRRIPTRVCQGRVVTMDLPTLRTNLKQSQSENETQEARDLATLHSHMWTVREARADGLRTSDGRSASLEWTVRKTQQNHQKRTLKCGRSVPYPRTVREKLVPRRRSATSEQNVRQTSCHKTLAPRKIHAQTRKNWTNT
jgi:hypothetical protein